jgi:hypothetical protein
MELAVAVGLADRRVAEEVEKARLEEAEKVRAEADQRLGTETMRVRQEVEQTAAQAAARARHELEQTVADASRRLREEMDAAIATERERFNELETERSRLALQIEEEQGRARAELADHRDRASMELEAERLKVRTLSTALEDARAALSSEREARESLESAHAVAALAPPATSDDLTQARAAERQSQLAIVDQLANGVRAIAAARSLSDTLSALLTAAAAVAPRVALFVVNGRELQGWRAAGFGDHSPASLRLSAGDGALLTTATTTGVAVSTATAAAPKFAALGTDRAALAVPIVVGGQSVAVLYADDGASQESEAPASWPEAMQILGVHASACLAFITALRTTQAIRATATGAARDRVATPSTEADSSARRYARLLISEIKLYNENAVRLGREKRDLLARLRPEIERARRLYDERVSPAVAARGTYFHEELVHTLADGDAALLGGAV